MTDLKNPFFFAFLFMKNVLINVLNYIQSIKKKMAKKIFLD